MCDEGNMKKTNYTYMEYLRVLCAFFVIVIHVSAKNLTKVDLTDTNWIIQLIYSQVGRFSVCVFCMISGALFLRPEKELTVRDMFTRYIKRIIICYIAWTVIYAILYAVLYSGGIKLFATRLVKRPAHLWYLLMLVGLYMVTPVLKRIVADRKLTLYLIWMLIISGFIFGTVQGVTAFFAATAEGSKVYTLLNVLLGDIEHMHVAFIPGYLGLFLLGHYIHEYGLGKWHRVIVLIAIPALLVSAGLTIIFSGITGSYVYTFMLETNPLVVLACAGIYAFFKYQGEKDREYNESSAITKAVMFVGSHTFGIYLVHVAILDTLDYFGLNAATYPAIISVPTNALLIFLISLVIAVIMKKIPGVRAIVS